MATTRTRQAERPRIRAHRPGTAPLAAPEAPAWFDGAIPAARIARRAYAIYLTDPSGTPEGDWLRAEAELRAEAWQLLGSLALTDPPLA